jgi:hypothetical protein
MDDNTKKDLVVGSASVGTAIAAGGLAGGALAMLVTLVSVTWSAIANRDLSKSQRLLRRMADEDTDPDAFIAMVEEKLRDNDEEILIKLRALIQADLEAISSDVYEPIARLGHAYVQGKCEAWIARGWVRVFSESTSREIDAFREVARALKRAVDVADHVETAFKVPHHDVAVVLFLVSPTIAQTRTPVDEHGNPAGPTEVLSPATGWSLAVHPQPGRFGLGLDNDIAPIFTEDAPRIFDLLGAHGVASQTRTSLIVKDERPSIQLTREAARALVSAFGV